METKQIWVLVLGALAIALVTSVISANITGNVIKLNADKFGKYQVYTKAEVDAKLKQFGPATYWDNLTNADYYNLKSLSATNQGVLDILNKCQYIHYKDYDLEENKTVLDVCKEFGYSVQFVVIGKFSTLHNEPSCNPSSTIFYTDYDTIISDKKEANYRKNNNICVPARFPDGSSNGNFSTKSSESIKGAYCCK